MSYGDGLCALAVEEAVEPGVPQFPACHFHRFAWIFFHPCRHIKIADIEIRVEPVGNGSAVTHVAHRFLAAEMEVAVSCAAVVPEGAEQGQKGHGIGASA